MSNIYHLLIAIILYLVSYSNISFLLNFKAKTKKNIALFFIGMFFFSFSLTMTHSIRWLLEILILTIIFLIYKKELKKIIIAILFHYLIILELDIMISGTLLVGNVNLTEPLSIIINILISILSYFFIRRNLFLRFWNMLESKLEEYINVLIFHLFIFIYLYLAINYNIMNIFVIIVLIILLSLILIKKMVEGYSLKTRIDELVKYMELCEKNLDELRINQHEYQNILLCIKSMTDKNKDATKFIDSILNDRINQDYILLKDVYRLKISPLRGLLYHKLSLCKEKKIQFVLNISPSISDKKIDKINENTLRDLSMIFGSLIDNAIEACMETQEKSLSIYIYEEKEQLFFQISNTFMGNIHIQFLSKKGYSTKGKKRGYGLSLVEKKLKENKKLSLKTKIHDDIFIQTLKLELK